jgi:hypothetical protein
VGSDEDANTQIDALVNGLHWCRKIFPKATDLTIVWGRRGVVSDDDVHGAIAVLLDTYVGNIRVTPQLDFKPWSPLKPDLSRSNPDWINCLKSRISASIPASHAALSDKVGSPTFRWYRSVTDEMWSGRVEGLEVCKVDSKGNGILDVGKLGKTGRESGERRHFKELVGGSAGSFILPGDVDRIATVIRTLAINRANGVLKEAQPEHRLESMVLRGAVPVEVEGIGRLTPAVMDVPYQVPTYWSENGRARFIDVLMRHGETPWVVELKVTTGGQASYYRHAIAQAALYCNYIRTAVSVHKWSEMIGLVADNCGAVVAIPQFRGPRKSLLLADLVQSASEFGVSVATLDVQGF